MGNYLNEPVTNKEFTTGVCEKEQLGDDGRDLGFTYAGVSMQGWRRTMEDTLVIQADMP